MWKNSLIFSKNLCPSTHTKIGEAAVSGSAAFSGNFKLRISHFLLFLGHLSPSQSSDAAHSTSPKSFPGCCGSVVAAAVQRARFH